jgi:hypothetical protein
VRRPSTTPRRTLRICMTSTMAVKTNMIRELPLVLHTLNGADTWNSNQYDAPQQLQGY